MVECFALDGFATQLEQKRAKEEENVASVPNGPAADQKTFDINQLLLAGIVLAIIILSCTALVYVARH